MAKISKRNYIKWAGEVDQIEKELNILDPRNPIEAEKIVLLNNALTRIRDMVKKGKPCLHIMN